MPIRVSKFAIARSRGVEVQTSAESAIPASGFFYTSSSFNPPIDGVEPLQHVIAMHGVISEGDPTFSLADGGKIQVKQAGTYRFDIVTEYGFSDGPHVGTLPTSPTIGNSGAINDANFSEKVSVVRIPDQDALYQQSVIYWYSGPGAVWLNAEGRVTGGPPTYYNVSVVAQRLGDASVNLVYLDENGN